MRAIEHTTNASSKAVPKYQMKDARGPGIKLFSPGPVSIRGSVFRAETYQATATFSVVAAAMEEDLGHWP